MNICARAGSKVVFKYPLNGIAFDQILAKENLVIGGVYTIKQIEVYGWSSEVEFEEVQGKMFNTVLFEDFYE